jgi:hypothetical protein
VRDALVRLSALLALAAACSPAGAADVDVTVESGPRGQSIHGYAEIMVRVVNRSSESREVKLTYPKSSYSYGGDNVRAVTRTVKVDGGGNLRVSLAWPERQSAMGDGLGVAVDGREFEHAIPVGGSRGYRSYGVHGAVILLSRSVDARFPDWMRPGGATHEFVRSDVEIGLWSPNWLGYTRFDGLVLTDNDLRTMPAEVKAAIGQYVECGGSLLVLGAKAPLPGNWKAKANPGGFIQLHSPGFGHCQVIAKPELLPFWRPEYALIHEAWTTTLAPFQRDRAPAEANRIFPVVDDVSIPVRGLVTVMFLFVILIGPVNLIVLARKKRKLWMFWTVPVFSFFTCLLVLGYMAVTEGWQGRSRAESFTILDESSRRASTIGWTGFYTPLVPRGGLHFSTDTEVIYQNGADPYGSYSYGRGSSNTALSMDWSSEQHLTSGWLTPRVPSHFAIRKSELRRERVAFSKGADGQVEAVNGLGADVVTLWYMDENGKVFRADGIAAGERASLKPASGPAVPGNTKLRGLYTGDWYNVVARANTDAVNLLAPRTYLAVLDAAPFMDEGMPGVSVRKTRSIVYGILKENNDGG